MRKVSRLCDIFIDSILKQHFTKILIIYISAKQIIKLEAHKIVPVLLNKNRGSNFSTYYHDNTGQENKSAILNQISLNKHHLHLEQSKYS